MDCFESNNFHIITGGPGVGKTTLTNELHVRGFKTVPEIAREIIRQQMEINGEGLPWKNKALYTDLMLEASIESYRKMHRENTEETVFFDRGIPDTLCYAKMTGINISKAMNDNAVQYRYNKKVFLLPAWKEIYATDNERKQDWEEAVYTCQMMKKTYQEYGYLVIEVPKTSVDKRISFILETSARLCREPI
jgi:predicted ATPase